MRTRLGLMGAITALIAGAWAAPAAAEPASQGAIVTNLSGCFEWDVGVDLCFTVRAVSTGARTPSGKVLYTTTVRGTDTREAGPIWPEASSQYRILTVQHYEGESVTETLTFYNVYTKDTVGGEQAETCTGRLILLIRDGVVKVDRVERTCGPAA